MIWRYRALRFLQAIASRRFLSAMLSGLGVLALLVKLSEFFLHSFSETLRHYVAVPFAAVALYAVLRCRPRNIVSCRLTNRDVLIEIAVGDVFAYPGALVVGSNTTFDTAISRQLISDLSVQGQFTRRYYADAANLDLEVSKELAGVASAALPGPRVGKAAEYEVGTVVRVSPQGRPTAYLVAIARLNEHGNARGTSEDLRRALPKLWTFIANRGTKERLVMPILGTGFSRVSPQRDAVVREIIQSFVAACADLVFCEHLTIVVSAKDAARHQVNLDELGAYLKHVCQYREFEPYRTGPRGTPLLPEPDADSRGTPDERKLGQVVP